MLMPSILKRSPSLSQRRAFKAFLDFMKVSTIVGDEILCYLQQLLANAVIAFNDARPVLHADRKSVV